METLLPAFHAGYDIRRIVWYGTKSWAAVLISGCAKSDSTASVDGSIASDRPTFNTVWTQLALEFGDETKISSVTD